MAIVTWTCGAPRPVTFLLMDTWWYMHEALRRYGEVHKTVRSVLIHGTFCFTTAVILHLTVCFSRRYDTVCYTVRRYIFIRRHGAFYKAVRYIGWVRSISLVGYVLFYHTGRFIRRYGTL